MPIVALILAALLLMGTGFDFNLNVAPNTYFECNPESGSAPLEVAFSATTSADPDGEIGMFGWSFGDSSTGSGVSVVHTFVDPGSYDVALIVMDSTGAIGRFSRTVEVSAPRLLGLADAVGIALDVDGEAQTGSNFLRGNKSRPELLGIGDTGRLTQGAEIEGQTGPDSPLSVEFASKSVAFEDSGGRATEEVSGIIEVTLHAARLLHALGGTRTPEVGHIYVVVEVEVASRGPRLFVALSDFQLVDASERVAKPDLGMQCLTRPLEPATIRAGQRAEGEILFETHRSKHYILEYGAMLAPRIRFRFSL